MSGWVAVGVHSRGCTVATYSRWPWCADGGSTPGLHTCWGTDCLPQWWRHSWRHLTDR